MVNSKNAFWMALVFAIVVFVAGLGVGVFFEQSRANSVEFQLLKSEISLFDEQIRNELILDERASCGASIQGTFEFADSIYGDAVLLEKYDSVSKFNEDLKEIHKRYDLLRVMLWNEAIYLKSNCNASFHTVIYFFDYKSDNGEIIAVQSTFSKLLIDIKNKHPNEILLIPIAANLKLESVDMLMNNYDLDSGPVVLIDEREVIDELMPYKVLENIIFQSNKE